MNRLLRRAGYDGSTARKCSQSPTKKSSDFSFLQKDYRSSIELAKKFKQVKQEKIDKLHERLQGNTKAKVQEVVEVVEDDSTQEVERTKKRTRGLITIGRMEEKKERVKVNQIQSSSQRKKEKLKNHEAMEGFAQVDGYANQEHQVVITNKESEQGTSKKRKHGKATMDMLLENLQGNSKGLDEGDSNMKRNIAAKSDKHVQQKLSLDTVMSNTQSSKKVKKVPLCPSMTINDFIQLQHSKGKATTKSLEGENSPNNCNSSSKQPLKVNQNQTSSRRNREQEPLEDMEVFAQPGGNINQEEEVAYTNKEAEEGTSKRRTRGLTLCNNIHARTLEEREEVTFNDDGQPIGPTNKAVSNLSLFLGTLARKATFCPLTYTNWASVPDRNIKRIWAFTKLKFILPEEGRDWVETTVRDAWRRYKCKIKKDVFLKYSNMTARLKHRPSNVPEPHFRQLCEYWSLDTVKAASERNKRSRAKQKWRHRMGPRNFAITRENLRAKEKREPTQGEIFIETRKGNKGKQLDPETTNAISQVQQLIENEECSGEALQAVLGKERNGMMLCMGRNVTKTSLKQKEKINALKQAHNEEVASLNEKMESLGDTVGKLQYAFGVLLQQCRPGISVESLLEDLIGISPGDINSSPKVVRQPHSSTSTHVPHCKKNNINGDEDDDDLLRDDLDEFQDEEQY